MLSSKTNTPSSSFSPRVYPRPTYPPVSRVLFRAVQLHLRDAIFGCMICVMFWQPYQMLAAAWPYGERWFFSLTLNIGHTTSSILFNGGIFLCEYFGLLGQYKMSRKTAEEPSPALYKELITHTAVNHLVTTPIVGWLIYPITVWLGTPAATSPLPSLLQLFILFVAAHSFNDWGFYWSHRIFHTKALYKVFHKQHHAFRGSVGAAAEYANPVEVLIANQIPTVGLLLGIGAHPLVQIAWLIVRLLQTYEVHSGYDFTDTWACKVGIVNGGAAFHDHHHTANMGNFGAEHMDWLFGTMDHYVKGGEEEGYRRERGTLSVEKKLA